MIMQFIMQFIKRMWSYVFVVVYIFYNEHIQMYSLLIWAICTYDLLYSLYSNPYLEWGED